VKPLFDVLESRSFKAIAAEMPCIGVLILPVADIRTRFAKALSVVVSSQPYQENLDPINDTHAKACPDEPGASGLKTNRYI
jgi:hypothetical protein